MALDKSRLRKSVRKLRKFLKTPSKQPTPEMIHDFRTQARRFEAIHATVRVKSRGHEKRLLNDLSRLRRRAGKIRDMDVLTGCASAVQMQGEQDCSVRLLEYLGAERYKHASKLRDLVQKRGLRLRQRLKRSSKRLENLLGQADEQRDEAVSVHALRHWSDLRTPASLNKENLHSFRLKVKQLRYVLQLSDAAYQRRFIEKLGEVKDAIGEWHDWEELIAMATEVLDHGGKCGLLQRFRGIATDKFEEALSLANEMRNAYLGPRHTNGRRPSGLKRKRGFDPIVAATSAIVDRRSI